MVIIEIGKLNKRITIQQKVLITDDEGYQKEDWKDVATVWSKVENLHGREFFQAQAVNSKASCKFTIRYKKGLSTAMRILYDGKLYNILYVDDIQESHRFIEIMSEVIQ